MVWIEHVISQIVGLIGQGHPTTLTALFLVVVLAELGVPFPFIPDSALFLTGYKNGFAIQSLYTFLIVFSGRQCGASLTYLIARLLGRNLLNWLSKRHPKQHARINDLLSRLNRRTPVAIAFLRLGGLLYVPSIAAGIARLPYRYLIMGVALSSLIFDGATITLGILTGHGFRILGFTPTNTSVVIGFIVIMVVIIVIQSIIARRKKHN